VFRATYKKLTITLEEEIYEGLHRMIGRGSISQFIAELVRPHVVGTDLEKAYADMAADEAREREALEWAEDLAGDVLNVKPDEIRRIEKALRIQLGLE
jgi:predicted CopG family antitoxin